MNLIQMYQEIFDKDEHCRDFDMPKETQNITYSASRL